MGVTRTEIWTTTSPTQRKERVRNGSNNNRTGGQHTADKSYTTHSLETRESGIQTFDDQKPRAHDDSPGPVGVFQLGPRSHHQGWAVVFHRAFNGKERSHQKITGQDDDSRSSAFRSCGANDALATVTTRKRRGMYSDDTKSKDAQGGYGDGTRDCAATVESLQINRFVAFTSPLGRTHSLRENWL